MTRPRAALARRAGVLREPRAAALPEPIAVAHRLARTLTPREHGVFELLGLGYDNRSIARELKISERTVKRYVTAILTKLGSPTIMQVTGVGTTKAAAGASSGASSCS
jgi:DNA-binding NarL/FixJ family response regulator